MAGKLLLGAGAAALFAFGATGAARAADVSPIIVPPTVTPVVVVPAGPKIEITAENWLELSIEPQGDPDQNDLFFNTYHDFSIKVTSARGLGFEFLGNLELGLPFPNYREAALTGRVFLARGDAEVGLFTTAYFDGGFDALGIGGDFAFDTDRFTLTSYVEAFFDGGFDEVELGGDLTIHLGQRLDLYTGGEIEFDGGLQLNNVYAGAQFHLGPIAPYATVTFDGNDGTFFNVGYEFEQALGASPFSLLAYGDARIQNGEFPEYTFGIGIKFSHGGE